MRGEILNRLLCKKIKKGLDKSQSADIIVIKLNTKKTVKGTRHSLGVSESRRSLQSRCHELCV